MLKDKAVLGGAITAAFAASLCCIAPLLFVRTQSSQTTLSLPTSRSKTTFRKPAKTIATPALANYIARSENSS